MRFFRSIRSKLLLAFLVVVAPFIALQTHFYDTSLKARRSLLLRGEANRSRTIARAMEEYTTDLRRQAHATGISIAENEERWSRERIEAYMADLYKDNAAIKQIAWTQPSGLVVVGYPHIRTSISVAGQDYYKQINQGRNWVVSDLLIDKINGQPHFVGAYGVRDDSGRLMGILMMTVDPSLLSSLFESYTYGDESNIVITDSSNRIVYHSRYPKLPWNERSQGYAVAARNRTSGTTKSEFGVRIPKSDELMLAAETPISTIDWRAVTYRPVSTAMAPLSRSFRQSVLLGACISLIVLVAIFLLGSSLTSPILKLSNAVVGISRGNLSERVSISTGDEVEILASRFNLMAETLEQVQRLANKLLTDASLEDLVNNLAAGVAAVLGVERSAVFLFDERSGRVKHAASRGLSENYIHFTDSAPPMVTVCDRAASTMQTMVVNFRVDEALAPYASIISGEGMGSEACMPLVTGDGKLLGSIAGYLPEGQYPTEEQMSALQFFAGQAAVALENAQLHKETEMRAREMQVLWEVGQAIALKLDLDEMATTLATRLSSLIRADHCCLILYDTGFEGFLTLGKTFEEGASCHPGQARICENVIKEAYLSQQSAFGAVDGMRIIQIAERDGAHILAVPMLLQGHPIGVICLSKEEAGFTESDVRLVSALTGVAALAVENAMSYGKERRIAETLQSSFLPSSILSDDRVEIAEVYKPALDEANVGGDFYDLIQLPDNRIGIVMADVAGKGLTAAVHTAMVKYMLQAYAYEGKTPAQVLDSLNRAISKHLDMDSFVTLFFGVLDPATGELTYSNAGHEMPLLLLPDRESCVTLDVTGSALHIDRNSVYADRSISLIAGSILTLYTDGLSEARNGSVFFGMDGISRSLLNCRSSSARGAADCIVAAAVEHARGHLRDDVALIALKYLGTGD